jgi:predicted ABC-type ATPase
MNRDEIDIFEYNLGGSVSEMMRNPKLERDPLMTEEQAAYFASQLLPGAATLDATGNMPGMPSSDADLIDIFGAENNPSFLENVRQGKILDPALQALGVLGDATYAIPAIGATLGTALKFPRAAQLASRLAKSPLKNTRTIKAKGDYKLVRNNDDELSYLLYKDQPVGSGDFDEMANGWFMNMPGSQGKFFGEADEIIDFAASIRQAPTGGIDNLPQNIAQAPDGIESVDAARETMRRAIEDGWLEDFRKLVSDQTKLNTPEMRKMIDEHPFLVSSIAKMDEIPETSTAENFATQDWFDNRVFYFKDQGKVVGYDDAVDQLYENSRSLGWTDEGMEFPGIPARKPGEVKRAVIVLGPPASGKSSIANPLARKLNASILDPDEAKKLLPEFDGGVGSNATHVESKLITEQVRDIMIGNGDNILIPTVGLDPEKIRQQVKIYKNNGYLVDLVDVSVPADIARIRMLVRFAKSRKLIPPKYIDKVGDLPGKTYDILKKENIADGYSRIDNSVGIKDAKPLLEDTNKLFEGTDIQLRKSGR